MRRSPIKRGTSQLKRGGPLPRESAKRKAEAGRRAKTKRDALDRDGRRCTIAVDVPEVACWHPAGPGALDGDEYQPRGRRPGGHLDVDNVRGTCRAHHDWLDANPIEAAHRHLRPYPAGYMGPRAE